MDPKLFEYFARVAELGSINLAARLLDISQPSLSRHIAALEREVKAELFVRGQRGVSLTTAGCALLEQVRPIIEQISQLRGAVGRSTAEQVVVAMPSSLRTLVTGPMVASLSKTHPLLRIRVYEGLSDAIRGWQRNGLIDVGIVAFGYDQVTHFDQTPLVREPLLLVGSRDTKLDQERPVDFEHLASLKFVMPGRPNRLRHIVENAMQRRGIELQSAIEAESVDLNLEFVARGVGYTILPYSAIHGLRSTEHSWAPVVGLFVAWGLVLNDARKHAHGIAITSDALVKTVHEAVARKQWHCAELTDTSRSNNPESE